MRPLAIDLFCGLGGWTKGFLAEGYRVIGFDIECFPSYLGELVLQDVLTLSGAQFRSAACIVASPPCQAYSYRAMPWKRAKALPPPDNTLFDACFRIQREACEAAGCYVPMVVENVKGAQPWVGRAAWHYGSFYLWGDVPALMPFSKRVFKNGGNGRNLHIFEKTGKPIPNFSTMGRNPGLKNNGGSWFAVANNTESGHSRNPVNGDGVKQGGEWWHDPESITRRFSSASLDRKAASAAIAEIPFDLAQWIAHCFKPSTVDEMILPPSELSLSLPCAL